MRALSGHVAERAARALDAGCDIALHCSGEIDESEAVLAEVPELPSATAHGLQRLLSTAAAHRQDAAPGVSLARLETLLATA
jgi:beta-N-acetylhexosaminidase